MRENDIDPEPDQFDGDLSKTLAAALRPANLNRDVATFHPTEFAQPLHECGEPFTLDHGRGGAQESDGRQLCRLLLRARRERPRRRAAEQCDERAPFHCPMPPVLSDRKDSTPHYGGALRRGISKRPMTGP